MGLPGQPRRSSPPAPNVIGPQRTPPTRRSLVTEILTLQLAITGAIALIALGGLAWTSGSVIRSNVTHWARQWAGELNELGAPFYLDDRHEALLDVERFVAKYPEIARVTWYRPDGSVLTVLDKSGPVDAEMSPLSPEAALELSEEAGARSPYLLSENIEGDRRFRLSGPIWIESFVGDGLFGLDPERLETEVDLLGFVAVDLDFTAYQGAFLERLLVSSFVLIGLLLVSWVGGRSLLKRALGPLTELEGPLEDLAEGALRPEFPESRHSEIHAIVTALGNTLRALEKREKHLLHLADHDPLTGLYSRHRLASELEAEIEKCGNTRRCSALCFVDLDQFKYINDTCGHSAGDQLLKLAAEQLSAAVRAGDFVARFGGDEFIVLLKNVSWRQVRVIANHLLGRMRALRYAEQGHVFQLQCSIGIATISSSRFNSDELIAQADMACQTAKAHGRNRFEIYKASEKQGERMVQDIRWMRVIRDALENDDFVLHYQPMMHIRTGVVSHYEALLRLRTGRGLIGPQTFLPAAMRFGLMPEIDRWVVGHAVAALAEFLRESPDLRLSVNLSGFAFENDSFADGVGDLLKRHSVPGDRIVLEITEQMAVRFADGPDTQIAMLRDLGCRFAVDDFGSGYSSFSYLKRLSVDYLKIDGSFIRDLARNRVDQSMVRMVGEVARVAGMQTVAEYVQSAAAFRLLAKYGIDYAQGFYIGRAVERPRMRRMRDGEFPGGDAGKDAALVVG
jgi:diguanylate cyclase (GGDEF)-like protein